MGKESGADCDGHEDANEQKGKARSDDPADPVDDRFHPKNQHGFFHPALLFFYNGLHEAAHGVQKTH